MTDQTIPADKIRKIIAFYRDGASDRGGMILDALHALLPAPPRPTLADMTAEERAACQWMQADVENRSVRCVIATPYDEGSDTALVSADGEIGWMSLERVTPRPDLPRMEWPGDKKPAPAPALPDGWRLADHKDYGRVIVTTQTPDRDGYVYVVIPDAGNFRGYDWHFCDPDELTYLDTSPAPSTLAVGSEWDDVDALNRACDESKRDQIVVTDKDGYAYVWDKAAEWWEGSMPPRSAPYTIIHTGRKADQ